ncbi:ATP-dependent DNA helicase RecG [Salegentibacter echinorum]|uniref:ATP-dependent DNA helicase RecG n=1 Tax=Salegentibacter echinorum TaxID=1073325 RepID=A0A1M5HK00_SALEC|nr:ATP-binding protein [Salegentibacter echinorum]SHG16270.1 ATP-dependent DNA helicase RecG [Salegentibacter echinorum]
MQEENKVIEYKSLAKVTKGSSGLKELAITCVCLANTQGGNIIIGVEDKSKMPPSDQKIPDSIMNTTVSRLRNLCFNVSISLNDKEVHENGGEFFSIAIHPTLKSIATTSEGKIFIRIGDQCQPARGEDIVRLASEKDAFQWELQIRNVKVSEIPEGSLLWLGDEIRNSDRVKPFVKEMSDIEIAEHYNLVIDGKLTNLGILWLGDFKQRSRIVYPLTVQYIVYDELEKKVRKVDWTDNTKNPKDLLLDIEKEAIELGYFDEFPQGFFRNKIRHYDGRLIRELLINAIAHKSYTISGDIFIRVYPNRLEITNPGGLPLGITKDNILHTTNRRNPHLIRILHDLKLMEGEGSGYDLIYEITGRDSKPYPEVISDFNSTTVSQSSKILDEEAVLLMDFIAKSYPLSQKELIALGIVARHKKVLTTQLTRELQLNDEERVRSYIGKLLEKGILISRGIKKGTEYLINPKLLKNSKINIKPTLKVIEPHRLKALIIEDLERYPRSEANEIRKRLEEVPIEDIRKIIYKMVRKGELEHTKDKTYRKYWLAKKNRNNIEN